MAKRMLVVGVRRQGKWRVRTSLWRYLFDVTVRDGGSKRG
jgi:hypothetical protein